VAVAVAVHGRCWCGGGRGRVRHVLRCCDRVMAGTERCAEMKLREVAARRDGETRGKVTMSATDAIFGDFDLISTR
jgi:hypothetical protein